MTAAPQQDTRRQAFCRLQSKPELTEINGSPTTRFRVRVDRVRHANRWGDLIVETLMWAVVANVDLAINICESDLGPDAQLYVWGNEIPATMINPADNYARCTIIASAIYVALNKPVIVTEPLDPRNRP